MTGHDNNLAHCPKNTTWDECACDAIRAAVAEALDKAVERVLNWWATDAGDICLDDCDHRECRAARSCVAAVRGDGEQ